MFILRNYNRFLINADNPRWDDFNIHRFKQDFRRLIKFDTRKKAEKFLDKHPELEADFDAWIELTTENDWE